MGRVSYIFLAAGLFTGEVGRATLSDSLQKADERPFESLREFSTKSMFGIYR